MSFLNYLYKTINNVGLHRLLYFKFALFNLKYASAEVAEICFLGAERQENRLHQPCSQAGVQVKRVLGRAWGSRV